MRGLIENKKVVITALADECFEAYKWCFGSESTERWIKKFAASHWQTIADIQRDEYDNVLSNNSRSIFIKRFTELMLVWVEECKKNKKKEKK